MEIMQKTTATSRAKKGSVALTPKAAEKEAAKLSKVEDKIIELATKSDIDLSELARKRGAIRNPNNRAQKWVPGSKGRKPNWLLDMEKQGIALEDMPRG